VLFPSFSTGGLVLRPLGSPRWDEPFFLGGSFGLGLFGGGLWGLVSNSARGAVALCWLMGLGLLFCSLGGWPLGFQLAPLGGCPLGLLMGWRFGLRRGSWRDGLGGIFANCTPGRGGTVTLTCSGCPGLGGTRAGSWGPGLPGSDWFRMGPLFGGCPRVGGATIRPGGGPCWGLFCTGNCMFLMACSFSAFVLLFSLLLFRSGSGPVRSLTLGLPGEGRRSRTWSLPSLFVRGSLRLGGVSEDSRSDPVVLLLSRWEREPRWFCPKPRPLPPLPLPLPPLDILPLGPGPEPGGGESLCMCPVFNSSDRVL